MLLKVFCTSLRVRRGVRKKMLLTMKITAFLIMVACLQVSARGYAQITLSEKNVPLAQVFKEIQKQSGYDFLYTYELLEEAGPVTVNVRNVSLPQALDACLRGKNLRFWISDHTVGIRKKEENPQPSPETSPPAPIKGKVTSEKGEPLEGATIMVKGSKKGITTDANGLFELNASDSNAVLKISFTGYMEQEVRIEGRHFLNIVMKLSTGALEQQVVIGYGSIKRKDVTGAIASVSSKDFQKAPVVNSEELIANKIPGVQITPMNGRPGSGSNILIRGGSSLNASNDPLIVIDGVAIEGWNGGPGMLSQLNPNDIENFTVLKDASAAAIYGSRGSNGVILITTKKGHAGKLSINFNSTATVSRIIKEVPVMNGDQFRQAASLASKLTGSTPQSPMGDANTNWQNEIYQTSLGSLNNLSFSGAIKTMPYRLSMGYVNQNGILKTDNYKRGTLMLNLNPNLLDNHLKINFSLKGSYEKQRLGDSAAIQSATNFDPTLPVYDKTSKYNGYTEITTVTPDNLHGHFNPVGLLYQNNDQNQILRSIGNIQIDYQFHFLQGLHINVNTGYDVSRGKYSIAGDSASYQYSFQKGYQYNADPSYNTTNSFLETYLNYTRDIPSIKSHFDAIAGYSYNNYATTAYNYPVYNSAGTVVPGVYDSSILSATNRHLLISFYGRLNYSFEDKYILTATVRRDGSSRFSDNNRWGVFPSAAVAWRLSEEKFLKNNKTISSLKLRFGYGVTGQQDGIGNYDYIPVYYRGSLQLQTEIGNNFYQSIIPQPYDPDRKWEQTATTNLGVDFGFLNNRINGSIDLYSRNTTDLLNSIDVPAGTNFTTTITKNIGSMKNKGIEFVVNVQAIRKSDMSLDLSFNAAYNRNEITKLSFASDSGVGLTNGSYLVNTVGYSRNTWYLYHQAYDAAGKPLEDVMVDVNKDGIINNEDLYRSKSATPDYIFGFSANFSYKHWTTGFALHADLGQYLYYAPANSLQAIVGGVFTNNVSTDFYKTGFYRPNDQFQYQSDYNLQNASFLKMDNIHVGYSFGNIIRSARQLVTLRLDASVQHVFTITHFTGQDPEAGFNGGYQNLYPVPRIYALGLNLDF